MNFGVLGKNGAIAGGILGLVMAILSIIPFIGCLNCILMFGPGVLAAMLSEKDTGSVSVGEGAVAGAISGIVSMIISAIISIPIVLVIGGGSMMGQQIPADAMAAGAAGMVIGMIIGVVVGGGILAAVNAGTGAIYALIKNR